MVDVNKCFVGAKIQWADTNQTVTYVGEKPVTKEKMNVTIKWEPLIKPPTDDLVWRPVSHFCL